MTNEYGRIHTDGSRSGGQPIPSAMTNEERAALVERLRHDADDLHDFQTAADLIEADGQSIAELEAENERLKGNDILYWEMSGGVRLPAGVAVREAAAPDGAANPVTVKVTMIGSRDD